MPLWGSVDNAANSDIAVLMQFNQHVDTANQAILYGNTTTDAFITNEVVGQFGIDVNEQQAMQSTNHAAHAGWVVRHQGTGLKAGRVWYETMVAMGSMSSDGSDDTYIPDYTLTFTTQPSSNSTATPGNLTFTVVSSSTPSGATLTYKWQRYNGGWIDVANTAGRYFNNTSPTFTANNVTANGNVFRVLVSATGANTITSSNATISYVV